MFVIKKEEIKKDIYVKFEGNTLYGDFTNNPIISLIDGELVIDLSDCKIFKGDMLEDFRLKRSYIADIMNGEIK